MTIDLTEFMRKPLRGPCVVAVAMMGLQEDERDKLEAALNARHIQNVGIVEWCRQRPATRHLGDGSISRHRRGLCSCEEG